MNRPNSALDSSGSGLVAWRLFDEIQNGRCTYVFKRMLDVLLAVVGLFVALPIFNTFITRAEG